MDLVLALALAAATAAPPPAPEALDAAARRMARAIAAQLAAAAPAPPPAGAPPAPGSPARPAAPVRTITIAPPEGADGAEARRVVDVLAAAFRSETSLRVRSWAELERGARDSAEAARRPAAARGPAQPAHTLPALGPAQATPDRPAQGPAQATPDRAVLGPPRPGGTAPTLEAVQAVVVPEFAGRDGLRRLTLRAVAVSSGLMLASESAVLSSDGSGAESLGVDVVLRRLSDAVAEAFARMPGNARYRRLAVLPFDEIGADTQKRQLGTLVSVELTTDLRRDHGLLIVERARLGAVLSEAKLASMGLVDRKAVELGRLADAQALVVGTVGAEGPRHVIHARVVSAESGETLAAASESVASQALVAFSADAVVLRSRTDAMFRSMLLPGWGQAYNREPIKAAVVAGAAVACAGTALAFHVAAERTASRYRSAPADGSTSPAQLVSLRSQADRQYGWRNAFLWATAGVWAVNVADAYFSGVDGDRMVALELAPAAPGLAMVVAGRF